MAAMNIRPEELQAKDIIPGNPTRVVRSITERPDLGYVVVVCETGPDYFAAIGEKLWITRD